MDWIKESPVKFGIIVVVVLGVIVGGFFLNRWWNTPLGTPLDRVTETVEAEVEATAAEETEPQPTNTPAPTATPAETATQVQETATPEPQTMCGGPDRLTVLVAGIDSEGYQYGLADAIRVVQVDYVNGEVDVLPLPRDLWVEIPVSVPGVTQDITNGKLNQAYFYGSPGMGYYDSEDYGPGLLAKTLETNFGVEIDNYLTMNTRIFQMMVDELGGLPVYLPNTVYKHYFDEPRVYLEAGSYLLDGKQAEMVARHRTVIGDFGRQKNQTILLKAFIKTVLTPEGIQEVPDLVEIYRENVLIDFTPKQVSQLACLASKMDLSEDVHFLTFPQEMLTEERKEDKVQGIRTYALTYQEGEIEELLQDFLSGQLSD